MEYFKAMNLLYNQTNQKNCVEANDMETKIQLKIP